jgi:hypothetical protein
MITGQGGNTSTSKPGRCNRGKVQYVMSAKALAAQVREGGKDCQWITTAFGVQAVHFGRGRYGLVPVVFTSLLPPIGQCILRVASFGVIAELSAAALFLSIQHAYGYLRGRDSPITHDHGIITGLPLTSDSNLARGNERMNYRHRYAMLITP